MHNRDQKHLRDSVGTSSNGLVAALAVPDSGSLTLDCVLAAECADVTGMLLDFHLLHLLTQGGTVSVFNPSDQDPVFQSPCALFFVFSQNSSNAAGMVEVVQCRAYLVPYLPVTPTSGNSS